jgi:hypothetical protein
MGFFAVIALIDRQKPVPDETHPVVIGEVLSVLFASFEAS